jgi:hypothetical protein
VLCRSENFVGVFCSLQVADPLTASDTSSLLAIHYALAYPLKVLQQIHVHHITLALWTVVLLGCAVDCLHAAPCDERKGHRLHQGRGGFEG